MPYTADTAPCRGHFLGTERKLHPYRFTVRNGAGTYCTTARTLKQARAELLAFFRDELVSVERCPVTVKDTLLGSHDMLTVSTPLGPDPSERPHERQ